VKARSSHTDVGREIAESGRVNLRSVVSANIRRAQEAVRVLEEYGKVFSPSAAPAFKRIRYRLYDEEKKILKQHETV
jgi:thiamine-phosphate pyrophosphorylase